MIYVDTILSIGYFHVLRGSYDENRIEDKPTKSDPLEASISF